LATSLLGKLCVWNQDLSNLQNEQDLLHKYS